MEENINRIFPCTWYAAGYSNELKQKPIRKKIIGREIVLYRNKKGDIQALHAFCPHRGADLSLGCVKDGRLMCAYHGWEFNGEGKCLDIPSQPDKPIPKFAHTASFPVIEEAGLIWIYPDPFKDDVPPFHILPDLKDKRYRLSPYQAKWNAHFTRVVESVLDVAHLSFVHKKTIGKKTKKAIPDLPFTHENNNITIHNGGGLLEYWFPQQWILRPANDTKNSFINFVTFTPIDEEETMIYGYAGRTFAKQLKFMDKTFSKYSLKILDEDKAVVESQHPRPIPEALRMEAHVYADGPQIAFRKRWFEFLSNNEPRVGLDEPVKVL